MVMSESTPTPESSEGRENRDFRVIAVGLRGEGTKVWECMTKGMMEYILDVAEEHCSRPQQGRFC